jgi:hypothetical protein
LKGYGDSLLVSRCIPVTVRNIKKNPVFYTHVHITEL